MRLRTAQLDGPAEAVPVPAAWELDAISLGPAGGGARVQAPRLRLRDLMASTPSAAWPAPAGRTSGQWPLAGVLTAGTPTTSSNRTGQLPPMERSSGRVEVEIVVGERCRERDRSRFAGSWLQPTWRAFSSVLCLLTGSRRPHMPTSLAKRLLREGYAYMT